MILVIGEILFDLFPDDRRIGGAPFNFAFHLRQLGFDVRFISRVGKDSLGNELKAFLHRNGFPAEDLQTDTTHATGRVTVSLTPDGSHSFDIVRDTAYDHLEFNDHLKKLCTAPPELIYFGTLIQRTDNGRALVKNCLSAAGPTGIKFCDINLRPACYTPEVVADAVAAADILKLSDEELHRLDSSQETTQKASLETQIKNLARSSDIDTVILTRGKKGSIWATREDILSHPVPSEDTAGDNTAIADTVGAGDAYAAMAAAGRLNGLPDGRTMSLAQDFASRICSIRGALPQSPSFYTDFKRGLSR